MEDSKECRKCHRIFPITYFYENKSCSDGHEGRCKDCARKYARENYDRKTQDNDWREKERARGREKYRRLHYVDKTTEAKETKSLLYPGLRNAKKRLHISSSPELELHHWNYNENLSVFQLPRMLHRRVHTMMTFNVQEGIYYYNGIPLDTMDKHLDIIYLACDKFGFDREQVSVYK